MGLNNWGVITEELFNTSSLGPSSKVSYLDATFSNDTDTVGPSSKVSYLDAAFSSNTDTVGFGANETGKSVPSIGYWIDNPIANELL